MEETDNLIVGMGPAGCLCGIKLTKGGRRSIIVDKAAIGRRKLCAGVLTAKSRDCLRTVLSDGEYRSLINASLASQESHLRLLMATTVIDDCDFTDKKMIPLSLRDHDNRFVLVDRPSFDHSLATLYIDIGGKIIDGDGVDSIDFTSRTATLHSGRTISYRNLIVCDGATSHIEHLLKAYDPSFQTKKGNTTGYEINVDRKDLDIDGVNIHFGYAPKTYAWSFAKGDKICLGMCKLAGVRFDASKAMRRFCDDLGLRNANSYKLHGAMLPFDNPMPRPLWHDHVFFCGDAAGLNEAVTGEGIYYALQSGADAAASIIDDDPKEYLRKNKDIKKILNKGSRYQHLIAIKPLFRIFKHIVSRHPRFLGYFYLTQIDHATTHLLPRIVIDFLRDR